MAEALEPIGAFINIPEELVDKIFEFLSKIDMVFVQRVCRSFYTRSQYAKKTRKIENFKLKGYPTGVIHKKWDRFRFDGGHLYTHLMRNVTVFNPDGTETATVHDLGIDSRFTSVTMLSDGGMVSTGYSSKITILSPSVLEGENVFNEQKIGLDDNKTVTGAVVKNEKIYACTSFNQVNVWDLNGSPVGEFLTPFCSSELTLSSDGSVIWVYFNKQNRLYAYREDNYKYIAEFHFAKYKAAMTSMKTYSDKLYVLLASGNINIFEASEGSVSFSKVVKIGHPVSKFCPFGSNIFLQTQRGCFVANINSKKVFAKINFGVRDPQDFVVGPSGDLEILYFARDWI
jgi:hypothetical protein